MADSWQDLMARATEARSQALTDDELDRRDWVERRNRAIQAVGPRPVDGITFAKQQKAARGG